MPVATDAFREFTCPLCGMDTTADAQFRMNWLTPEFSPPATSRSFCMFISRICSIEALPAPSSAATKYPASNAILTYWFGEQLQAIWRCSHAPADDFATDGMTSGAPRRGSRMFCQPKTSALRMIAPTLCGSSMDSSRTSRGASSKRRVWKRPRIQNRALVLPCSAQFKEFRLVRPFD